MWLEWVCASCPNGTKCFTMLGIAIRWRELAATRLPRNHKSLLFALIIELCIDGEVYPRTLLDVDQALIAGGDY